MNEPEKQCLTALEDLTISDGEYCIPFQPIMDATGLDRKAVRTAVRKLAADGLAKFYRALVDEEGNFAGAGYCITQQGRTVFAELTATEMEKSPCI